MKFCKDCEFCAGASREDDFPTPPGWPFCTAKVISVDPVWGRKNYLSCAKARETICPNGILFIDKLPNKPIDNLYQLFFKRKRK